MSWHLSIKENQRSDELSSTGAVNVTIYTEDIRIHSNRNRNSIHVGTSAQLFKQKKIRYYASSSCH